MMFPLVPEIHFKLIPNQTCGYKLYISNIYVFLSLQLVFLSLFILVATGLEFYTRQRKKETKYTFCFNMLSLFSFVATV